MTCWIQISSGRGPEECCWVVDRLSRYILANATESGLQAELVESVVGRQGKALRSSLLRLEGDGCGQYASSWQGSVCWIGESMFRPGHKRKNWFVDLAVVEASPQVDQDFMWNERDLRIEAFRASGPGGQHVNKTESAIRITHLPTGVSCVAQEERSQHRNKALALARLHVSLAQREKDAERQQQNHRWQRHNQLQRGNAVRTFFGREFVLKGG